MHAAPLPQSTAPRTDMPKLSDSTGNKSGAGTGNPDRAQDEESFHNVFDAAESETADTSEKKNVADTETPEKLGSASGGAGSDESATFSQSDLVEGAKTVGLSDKETVLGELRLAPQSVSGPSSPMKGADQDSELNSFATRQPATGDQRLDATSKATGTNSANLQPHPIAEVSRIAGTHISSNGPTMALQGSFTQAESPANEQIKASAFPVSTDDPRQHNLGKEAGRANGVVPTANAPVLGEKPLPVSASLPQSTTPEPNNSLHQAGLQAARDKSAAEGFAKAAGTPEAHPPQSATSQNSQVSSQPASSALKTGLSSDESTPSRLQPDAVAHAKDVDGPRGDTAPIPKTSSTQQSATANSSAHMATSVPVPATGTPEGSVQFTHSGTIETVPQGDGDTASTGAVSGADRSETNRNNQLRPEFLRPENARMIGRQMIDHVQTGRNGSVDIALNPEELGRIRMTLTPSEQGLHLSLSGDRAETVDLLRRHIAELQQEFSELGYGDVSFDFGGTEAGNSDADTQSGTESLAALDDGKPEEFSAPSRARSSHGGLDLRI